MTCVRDDQGGGCSGCRERALQQKLRKIETAWMDYQAALKNREHGAVAANNFIFAVEDALS